MENVGFCVRDIARIVACPGHEEDLCPIESIGSDSRSVAPGSLFVALRGERFDGHRFVGSALEQGAARALVDRRGLELCPDPQDPRLLICEDTERAFQQLAGAYRSHFPLKIVAVTGSVGKTTTKEMIAAVLESRFRCLKTQGNLNDQVGVPKTLFRLDSSYDCAVMELGMNHFGEIAASVAQVRPAMAVITNIGVQHLEFLGSRQGILQAKLEICQGLADGSPLILCGDNDLLATVEQPRLRVIRYGIENPACDILAKNIREEGGWTSFDIVAEGKSLPAQIPTFGQHNVLNALAAYAVGRQLAMEPEKIAQALRNYTPSGMRQRVVEHNGYTVVEDCYNCGPDSLRAAAAACAGLKPQGLKVLVLGDMLELGASAAQLHHDCGSDLAKLALDQLWCCGELSQNTFEGYVQGGGHGRCFGTKEELKDALLAALKSGEIPQGSVLWFKASNGIHLEEVLQSVYKEC